MPTGHTTTLSYETGLESTAILSPVHNGSRAGTRLRLTVHAQRPSNDVLRPWIIDWMSKHCDARYIPNLRHKDSKWSGTR